MTLKDMSARKRREVVALHLAPILRRLRGPVETRVLVEELLGLLDTSETKVLSETLFHIGRDLGPAQARQDGREFYRFGRPMRGWTWGPPPLDNDPGRIVTGAEGLEDVL